MAQSDWGGGRDLSGLFAGLQDQFIAQVEASKNRAIRQAEEDAAAEDAETYDKWTNGLISDEDWLTYIRRRLNESKGDKEEFQRWNETLRKHSDAIADGRMESAYQAGNISIHELITHYNSRLSPLKESPEKRELLDRYYNLVDQRDGDYIDEQSAIIVDRIERGQATYSDLLNFYASMDKRVRRNSPLKSQIKKQMLNIRQIAEGVGGGGGGGGGGRSGRGGIGQSSTDLATSITRANDAVTDYYRNGNVFVPQGENILSSVFDRENIENSKTAILDAMEADSRYIENMMEEWKENPDASFLTTPWGQRIANTAENRFAIYNQAIANYDFRVQLLNATGDTDGAPLVDKARQDFVEDIMQFDNSLQAQDYIKVRREQFNQTLNLAATAPDPRTAMDLYERAGRSISVNFGRLISESQRGLPEFALEDETIADLEYTRRFAVLIQGAKTMDVEAILTEGSLLYDERPENFWLSTDQIAKIIGTTEGPTGSGLAGRAAARDGQRALLDLRAGRDTEIEPWVYVAKAGESTPTLVKQSMVAEYLGIDTDDWQGAVRPFAERLSIKDQPAIVYRQMAPVQIVQPWYKNKKGKWATYEEINAIGRDITKLTEAGYTQEAIPEFEGWSKITDGVGGTWYVDPSDGQLYRKLPFRAGIAGSFDVADLVNDRGELMLSRLQGAEGLVMGVGPGVSLRFAQGLLMDAAAAGEIDLELYHPRDVGTGSVSFDNLALEDLDGMMWSPADAANERIQRAARTAQRNAATPWSVRNAPNRELMARQEERRVARVREWFDQSSLEGNVMREAQDFALDDAIARAGEAAGITFGRLQRPMDEAPRKEPVRRFETTEIERKATPPVKLAPVSPRIQTQRTVELDPIRKPPSYATSPVAPRATNPVSSTSGSAAKKRGTNKEYL